MNSFFLHMLSSRLRTYFRWTFVDQVPRSARPISHHEVLNPELEMLQGTWSGIRYRRRELTISLMEGARCGDKKLELFFHPSSLIKEWYRRSLYSSRRLYNSRIFHLTRILWPQQVLSPRNPSTGLAFSSTLWSLKSTSWDYSWHNYRHRVVGAAAAQLCHRLWPRWSEHTTDEKHQEKRQLWKEGHEGHFLISGVRVCKYEEQVCRSRWKDNVICKTKTSSKS